MANALNRSAIAAIAVGLFSLNVALNIPLFQPGETPYRDSIEGGYAGMARFFSAYPNPWGWNPTQYCGLPAQFTYLPSLPYLAGAISRLFHLEPDYTYRILASLCACIGPVTLFFFALYFTRNQWWALAAALAYTFFSPLYYLVHTIDVDRGRAYLPWRLQVLVKYGEGPHNAGLTLIPLVVMALWRAATTKAFAPVFTAAVLLAAVALTNWVAAFALAFCCLLLLLVFTGSPNFRPARVLSAGAVGYGLACFWLTPTFIQTIAFNWPADAFNYQLETAQELLLVGLPLVILLLHFALAKLFPHERYFRFVALAFVIFAWIVLWFYMRGLNTVPESRRYALEMEFFLLLFLVEALRLLLRGSTPPLRFFPVYAALVIFLAAWSQMGRYLTQGFSGRAPAPKEGFIEYRAAQKLAGLRSQGRVFASGGLRFRLNSWFPIPQVGGGFESGLRNREPLHLAYQIRTGEPTPDAVRDLEKLGVEYLIIHGPRSREHYRDFRNPRQFEGVLEPVWHEEDDTIYRVPFTSLAGAGRVVSWRGASALSIDGPVAAGEAVTLAINHDPGWRARQDGQPLRVGRDSLGFLTVPANPSPTAHIELEYHGTLEQRLMAVLSALVWIGSLAACYRHTTRRERAQ